MQYTIWFFQNMNNKYINFFSSEFGDFWLSNLPAEAGTVEDFNAFKDELMYLL